MSEVGGSLAVETLHWSGHQGGAIFTGRSRDGQRLRVVTDADAMPRPPRPGEIWCVRGKIVDHVTFGHQLQASSAILERPTGELLIGFLSGPSCIGIGKVKARQLYETFGDRLYDLLDGGDPEALLPIVSLDLADTALRAWKEQALEASTYRWLDAQGLPRKIAGALMAIYGDALPEKARENPYRLMAFLPWRRVEALARTAGIDGHDPRRLIAGIEAVVYDRLEEGHTATAEPQLLKLASERLECTSQLATEALRLAVEDNAVYRCDELIMAMGAATMEIFVADQLVQRLTPTGQLSSLAGQTSYQIAADLDAFEGRHGYSMNVEQRTAVELALKLPLSILTGGAGTGKTTALRAVHDICDGNLTRVYQIALAGRAAQRMAGATGRPAMTIAAFINQVLDGSIDVESLSGALVIIDEASMLDLPLTYRLLRRLPCDACLMVVGDPGQLPPIGFGLVLHVLAASGSPVPKTHLLQVHRQAASTGIPAVASAIREGRPPALPNSHGRSPGVSFIECADADIPPILTQLRADLGVAGTQIISSLRMGAAGTAGINRLFHDLARGSAEDQYLPGEPVMWIKNDHDLGLMNGSLGIVLTTHEHGLEIDFDGQVKSVSSSAVGNLEHAYAITVHKAQGSQFPRVIMPIVKSRLLDRTMLYTAITRAQEQVVLLGDRHAFEQAVAADGISSRRQVCLGQIIANRLTHPPPANGAPTEPARTA